MDPRVMTLPEPPMYRDGETPQSAVGVFIVGDATEGFSRTARLIDFSGGLNVGLAAGDYNWQDTTLGGAPQMLAVSASSAIMFALGAAPTTPMLLPPGVHYFRAVPDEAGVVALRFRLLDGQPEGMLTVNRVTS